MAEIDFPRCKVAREIKLVVVVKHDPEKWVPVFRKDHAQIKR
jgi:hypothetical protein